MLWQPCLVIGFPLPSKSFNMLEHPNFGRRPSGWICGLHFLVQFMKTREEQILFMKRLAKCYCVRCIVFFLVWNFYPFVSSISNKIVTIMKEKVTLCGEVLTWHNTWLEALFPPPSPSGQLSRAPPPTVVVENRRTQLGPEGVWQKGFGDLVFSFVETLFRAFTQQVDMKHALKYQVCFISNLVCK